MQSNRNGANRPTPAAEWRRPRLEGYVVTLPSGRQARLRPVALDVLLMNGQIPDLLSPIAARSLWTETDAQTLAEHVELGKGFAELINQIVPAAMLEPRVVSEVQADDEISLEDIDFADKLAIFNLATQPAEVLRSFRERQAASMAALSDGESDQQPAQRAT